MIAYATEDEPEEEEQGPERFNDSFEVGNDDFLIQSQAAADARVAGARRRRRGSRTAHVGVVEPPNQSSSWSARFAACDGHRTAARLCWCGLATPHSGDAREGATIQVLDVATGRDARGHWTR